MTNANRSPAGSRELRLPDTAYERLLAERIVVLGSEIDDELANRITAQLLILAEEDPDKDITLYINSSGGSVTAAMSIFDTMELINPAVATYVMGLAAGMAQVLFSSGAPGRRYALSHARLYLMRPTAGTGGTPPDVAIQTEVYQRWTAEIARITAERSGQPIENIIADGKRGRWFTASEARDYGLADHVVDAAQRPNRTRPE